MRRLPALPVAALTALVLTAVAACQSTPAVVTPSPVPVSVSATPGLSPGVTLDGSVVTVVGQGRSQSEPFELPAGSATMTITACRSNQVMPFITLVDGSGQSVGLIVDPEKVLNNLAGGTYAVSAQANPDCVWQVVIAPLEAGPSASP